MEFRTVVGVVFLEQGDFLEGKEHVCRNFYTLEGEDGTFYPLKFETGAQAGKVKINAKIAISIAVEPDENGEYLVSPKEKFFSLVTDYAATEDIIVGAPEGRPAMNIGIFRSVSPNYLESKGGVESQYYADEWDKVRKAAASVQEWFSQHYGNFMDFDVRGFCLITDKDAARSYYLEDAISEHKKKDELIFGLDKTWKEYFYHSTENPEGWKYQWHHAWSGRSSSICGWGRLGRPGSMTYISCSRGWLTMCHELGHNFGLPHSQSVSGEGAEAMVQEYGDGSCNMGRSSLGHNILHYNTMLNRHANGMEPRLIENLAASEAKYIVMVPHDVDDISVHEGEKKMVKASPYTLDMRDVKSNPFRNDRYNDLDTSVRLYTFGDESVGAPQGNNRGKPQYRGDLKTKTCSNGVLEKVDYVTNEFGTYGKSIVKWVGANKTEQDLGPIPEVDMGFPEVLTGVSLGEQHSGLWYNPKYNGQGLDIQVNGDQVDVMLYTYSRNDPMGSGKPYLQYFKGSCKIVDGVAEFDLMQPLGGKWDNPSEVTEEFAGRGKLFFYDDDHGVFMYDTKPYGYGAIELVKLMNRYPSAKNGLWTPTETPYHDIRVSMFSEDRIVAMFTAWDQKTMDYRLPAGAENSEQRWYLLIGTPAKDEKGDYFDCKVTQTAMGKGFSTQPYEEHEIGVAKLRFVNGDTTLWASFNYKPVDGGVTRKRTFKMEKKV